MKELWPRIWDKASRVFNNFNNERKLRRQQSDKAIAQGPSWRHRRRLIYGAYFVAISMIGFGALNVSNFSEVGVQMVIGGVALLSIILTSYTVVATYEDVKLWSNKNEYNDKDYIDTFDIDDHHGI
jgi:hypothetical protein